MKPHTNDLPTPLAIALIVVGTLFNRICSITKFLNHDEA